MQGLVLGEVRVAAPRTAVARLARPDVQRSAELAHAGHLLEQERERLDRVDRPCRGAGMHDVEGDDLDVREPLPGRLLEEPVLAHADLVGGVPAAAPDARDHALRQHLGVPEVRLEEQDLAPGAERGQQRAQVRGVLVVAEDAGADGVVERVGRQVQPVGPRAMDGHVGKRACLELPCEAVVEHDRRDRVLPAELLGELCRPQTASGAELEDRLAGLDVERVLHRQRAPAQLRRRRPRMATPVRLARELHLLQVPEQTTGARVDGARRDRGEAAAVRARRGRSGGPVHVSQDRDGAAERDRRSRRRGGDPRSRAVAAVGSAP